MSFRRIPKEIDPRRPPKSRARDEGGEEPASEPRSYGQYIEISPEELEELERASGEVVREGSTPPGVAPGVGGRQRKSTENREEFEDATDEVSREDSES
jgi:hypothetical protein